jgi:hypothetical protein
LTWALAAARRSFKCAGARPAPSPEGGYACFRHSRSRVSLSPRSGCFIPRHRTEVARAREGRQDRAHAHHGPFNPKHLEKVEKGYLYHLGFASLKLPCELKAGDVTVPAGELHARRALRGDGQWELVLFPQGLSREVATISFAMLDGKETQRATARKQLEDAAKKLNVSADPIVLPTTTAEHEDPWSIWRSTCRSRTPRARRWRIQPDGRVRADEVDGAARAARGEGRRLRSRYDQWKPVRCRSTRSNR